MNNIKSSDNNNNDIGLVSYDRQLKIDEEIKELKEETAEPKYKIRRKFHFWHAFFGPVAYSIGFDFLAVAGFGWNPMIALPLLIFGEMIIDASIYTFMATVIYSEGQFNEVFSQNPMSELIGEIKKIKSTIKLKRKEKKILKNNDITIQQINKEDRYLTDQEGIVKEEICNLINNPEDCDLKSRMHLPQTINEQKEELYELKKFILDYKKLRLEEKVGIDNNKIYKKRIK